MNPHQTKRPIRGRGIRVCLGLLMGAVMTSACAGENLFSLASTASTLTGPTVEITAPQAGFTVAVGDSLQVTANVSSPDGVSGVRYQGLFETGGEAFLEDVQTLPNPQDTTLTNFLMQGEGGATGGVLIILEATDIFGAQAADTVNIIIG